MKKYRRIVAVAVAMALLLTGCGAPQNEQPNIAAPEVAETAGMTKLAFYDDFDDPSTIDWKGTGKDGFKWYIDRPFGWDPLQDGDVTVADSVATIAPQKSHASWGISTYSAKGDTGKAFTYAYFEASIRIDLNKTKADLTTKGQPAFWSFSKAHTLKRDEGNWGEIDFFEVTFESDGSFHNRLVTSVHDSIMIDGKQVNRSNSGNTHEYFVMEGWHTYGCLWTPGEIAWYLDGGKICSQAYSADGLPSPASASNQVEGCYSILDQEEMLVILGSGPCWPMEVDWVRVWQAE